MLSDRMNSSGHVIITTDLPPSWRNLVRKGLFEDLYKDCLLATNSGHWLANLLESLTSEVLGSSQFSLELMLAKREGPQDEEQEGIWHDDASRDLAFSLSLNEEPNSIEGGLIGLRKKNQSEEPTYIKTRSWGEMVVFHTGKRGWDHKVTRVTHGNRLVLVGWLTLEEAHKQQR